MGKSNMKNFKKSFYDWCIENDKQDLLDRWDYDLNEFDPRNVSCNSNIKYYFRCLEESKHKPTYVQLYVVTRANYKMLCETCNSFGVWCEKNDKHELIELWDISNKINPYEISYASNSFCYFKCKYNTNHKLIEKRVSQITTRGINITCDTCNSFGMWCENNNRTDLLNWWDSDKNKYSPYEISFGNAEKIYLKCGNANHSSYGISPSSTTRNTNFTYKCVECNSFEAWCIEHNKNDLLLRWDYSKNNVMPSKVLKTSNRKYFFKCPINKHESESITLGNVVYGNQVKCSKCNSFGAWCLETQNEKYLERWDYSKNSVSPFEVNKGTERKYFFKCPENIHPSELKEIENIVYDKRGGCGHCIACKSFGQWGVNNFGEIFIADYWSGKNTIDPFIVSKGSSRKRVWLKCHNDLHDDFQRIVSDCTCNDTSIYCPKCVADQSKSNLQIKVEEYIASEYKYKITNEHNCSLSVINPKTKLLLPFDIEIQDIRLLIEVNGIQHYKLNGYHTMQARRKNTSSESEFKYQRLKDRYKRFMAHVNDYYYLEVPYMSEYDESYKELIDNKINEIIQLDLSAS